MLGGCQTHHSTSLLTEKLKTKCRFPIKFQESLFLLDVHAKYLNFKISYPKFAVYLSMDEASTHHDVQFGGCLVKIYQILSNLQVF